MINKLKNKIRYVPSKLFSTFQYFPCLYTRVNNNNIILYYLISVFYLQTVCFNYIFLIIGLSSTKTFSQEYNTLIFMRTTRLRISATVLSC